jgi:hypothetical protein
MWFMLILLIAVIGALILTAMYLQRRSRTSPADRRSNDQDDVTSRQRRIPRP